MISRLRMLPDEAYERLPDAGEGLHNRVAKAAREECSIDAILAAGKSKRYALSRIRRMVMCAALGITADMSADEGNVNQGYPVLVWQSSECEHLVTKTECISNGNGTHTYYNKAGRCQKLRRGMQKAL